MSVNVGSFVGAATVRVYAKGEATGEPNAAELDTMRAVVRRAMQDGAFGFASALIYPPGSFAGTNELTEMAKAMAPYHGVYITHMRSEENTLLEAIDEAMAIGHNGGVPVELYHLKAAGPKNWYKAPAMVAKIDSARNAGQDVGATMYPYSASGNGLSACLPQWASADGKLMANLRDSAMRVKIMAAATDTGPGALDLCQGLAGRIMVVGLTTPTWKEYDGMRIDKIAAEVQRPWIDALVQIVIDENNRPGKITFSMTEENVSMQLARPWVLIGTDAGGLGSRQLARHRASARLWQLSQDPGPVRARAASAHARGSDPEDELRSRGAALALRARSHSRGNVRRPRPLRSRDRDRQSDF